MPSIIMPFSCSNPLGKSAPVSVIILTRLFTLIPPKQNDVVFKSYLDVITSYIVLVRSLFTTYNKNAFNKNAYYLLGIRNFVSND